MLKDCVDNLLNTVETLDHDQGLTDRHGERLDGSRQKKIGKFTACYSS